MKDVIEKFLGLKVLVVGDVMVDAYLLGKVERISPEAPVPVVAVEKKEYRLGGAANVALNLASLGAKPILCSVIGEDIEGNEFLQLLERSNLNPSGIVRSKDRLTTTKTRVIAQQTQMLRVDHEFTEPISEYETYVLTQRILNDLLPAVDVVLFEDYDKGVITASLIEQIVTAAHKHGKKVVVDPKKRNFNFYRGVDLFKPNLKELKEGFNKDVDPADQSGFETMILDLMQAMELKNIMVTMSERGVMICDGKTFDYIPAHYRKIADVSGAGDTVMSVAALCYAIGLDNKQTAALSNLAGGLVCEEVGVVPINKERLIEESAKL
jgi:rfaE bifunctional protein kinase chain/domain